MRSCSEHLRIAPKAHRVHTLAWTTWWHTLYIHKTRQCFWNAPLFKSYREKDLSCIFKCPDQSRHQGKHGAIQHGPGVAVSCVDQSMLTDVGRNWRLDDARAKEVTSCATIDACTHQPGAGVKNKRIYYEKPGCYLVLEHFVRQMFDVHALCQGISPSLASADHAQSQCGGAFVRYHAHLTAGLREILVSSLAIATRACHASMASRSCSASQCRAASCLILSWNEHGFSTRRRDVAPPHALFPARRRCAPRRCAGTVTLFHYEVGCTVSSRHCVWCVKLFIISMIFDRFVQSLSP